MANEKPVQKLRCGGVCADVWKNKSKEGDDFITVSIVKSYLDEKSKEWKETNSFSLNDIKNLLVVCEKICAEHAVSLK